MKTGLSSLIAALAWFAIASQYYVVLHNNASSLYEATIRFFSYFTVLTNTLVALYFTIRALRKNNDGQRITDSPGMLTALTVYILVVGIIYQVALRKLWHPTGLQMFSDELLHTFIPLGTLIFWFFYEEKLAIPWTRIFLWLIYPLIYLIYTLIRGNITGEYPYPFMDVTALGIQKVIFNSLAVLLLLVFLSVGLLGIGKRISAGRS
jgi:hypothetical protein